jgi:hypothetical protein
MMSYQLFLVKFLIPVCQFKFVLSPGMRPTIQKWRKQIICPNVGRSDWLERKAEQKTFDVVRLFKFTQNLARYALKR